MFRASKNAKAYLKKNCPYTIMHPNSFVRPCIQDTDEIFKTRFGYFHCLIKYKFVTDFNIIDNATSENYAHLNYLFKCIQRKLCVSLDRSASIIFLVRIEKIHQTI